MNVVTCMRGLVLLTVVLLVASLAAAQEPAVGLSPTNQAALPDGGALLLALPKVGVELNTPRSPVALPAAGLEAAPDVELFEKPVTVAVGSPVVETGDGIVTVPLGSLELRRDPEVRAGGVVVSGPLIELFHSAKPTELPNRLLHLINPFAPMEARAVTPNVPNEHPRAWTARVGWNPGGSAFPDPRTHELGLSLFSMFTAP